MVFISLTAGVVPAETEIPAPTKRIAPPSSLASFKEAANALITLRGYFPFH